MEYKGLLLYVMAAVKSNDCRGNLKNTALPILPIDGVSGVKVLLLQGNR
jgi:hypothetical protein